MLQLPAPVVLAALVSAALAAPPVHAAREAVEKEKPLSKEARLAFIRKAQVWMPTDVSAMDLRAGPQGKDAFAPNAMIACDYVPEALPGSSRKFDCAIGDGTVLKVRYGIGNGEVEGAVLASRLLWALGFGADRVYPVSVACRGCSSDPWTEHERVPGMKIFSPAAIERKPEGHEMKSDSKNPGWAWPELALVDESQGGAPRAQRDALILLAVFMQHTDSKPEQQRLLCLPGGMTDEGLCNKPFLMLHDVGLTFGHGNFSNRTETGSVNFSEWARTPVWRDARACVGHLSRSHTGTLGDPTIREAGRAFLADLLVQLSDGQLSDLFEVAHVERRVIGPTSAGVVAGASVSEWMAAFKHKRDEVVMNHCPA
jgi:hypothetical protein